MRTTLKEYLPPILLQSCEFPLLCKAEQPEADAIAASADEVLDAQFVETASDCGLARFEKIYGIICMDTDTVEDRRFRILARMNEQMPYTVRTLHRLLTTMCGPQGYKLELVPNDYRLTIWLLEGSLSTLRTAEELLYRILPANLVRYVHIVINRDATARIWTAGGGTQRRPHREGAAILPRGAYAHIRTAAASTLHKTFGDNEVIQ